MAIQVLARNGYEKQTDLFISLQKMTTNVFFFDFDGVLAIPYSQPEVLFAGTEALLRDMRANGHVLLVTSFNPRAYFVLKHLLDNGTLLAIRAGSCERWWAMGNGLYSDATHRLKMEKSLHLQSMLEDEVREAGIDPATRRLFFVDDDLKNIGNVLANTHLYGGSPILTRHVPWYAGVGETTIEAMLKSRANVSGMGKQFKLLESIASQLGEKTKMACCALSLDNMADGDDPCY